MLGPIHLIARLLINWICVWLVKWNTILSHLWKLFQMALMKEKIIGPTSLNIYKPDNSFDKILILWWPFGSDVYSS